MSVLPEVTAELDPTAVRSRVAVEAAALANELGQRVDWLHVAAAVTTPPVWDETVAALLDTVDISPTALRARLVAASPYPPPIQGPATPMRWLGERFGYPDRIAADYLWAAYLADPRVARVLTEHGFDPLAGECLLAAEAVLPSHAATGAVTDVLATAYRTARLGGGESGTFQLLAALLAPELKGSAAHAMLADLWTEIEPLRELVNELAEAGEPGQRTSWSAELSDYLVVARTQFERTGRPVDTADLLRAVAMTVDPDSRFGILFRSAIGNRIALASAYYNLRRGAVEAYDRTPRRSDPGPRPSAGVEVAIVPEASRPITRRRGGLARAFAFNSDVTRLSYGLGARLMQLLYLQLCLLVGAWLCAGSEIVGGGGWAALCAPFVMLTRPILLGWKAWIFVVVVACLTVSAPLAALVAVNAVVQALAFRFEVRMRCADSGYPDVGMKDMNSDSTRIIFGRWAVPLYEFVRSGKGADHDR